MQEEKTSLPMVSVIIPCYKTEHYLPACIESILAQTYQTFEIIAVNDGSPDRCEEILNAYAQKDARVRIISQENRGLSGARNAGLDAARGDYILFLDSDDKLPPYAIEKLLDIARSQNVPVVVSRHLGEATAPCEPDVIVHREHILNAFVDDRRVYSSACNRLYARDAIGDLRFKEGIYFEDWPFQTILFSKISAYATTELPCYIYTNDNKSTTRSDFTLKKAESYLTGIRYIYAYFRETPYLRIVQKRLAVAMKMLIGKTFKSKNRDLQREVAAACGALFKERVVLARDLPIKARFRLWKMK